MSLVALLTNPLSTRNKDLLPRVREFVASRPNIFHVELGDISEIPEALKVIASVKPAILVINGGDGTVQATLTELYHARPFGDDMPPVAVLPNGKTNLIAADLGAKGEPLKALERIVEIAAGDVSAHVVSRRLIALSDGRGNRPVLGMFLGGAGLLSALMFCRNKIYPLGLSNTISHVLAAIATLTGALIGGRSRLSPVRSEPLKVTVEGVGSYEGRFFVLLVTTLEKLLLGVRPRQGTGSGALKLICLEQNRMSILRTAISMFLMRKQEVEGTPGLHLNGSSEIRIEGRDPAVILDGEIYKAAPGRPIVLTQTAPQPFLSLAA